tara:strand:+ start:1550 stop:1705 length:156 start_codon:yes stop_codon:yes gene_type:complete
MELSIIKAKTIIFRGKNDVGVKQAIPKLEMKGLTLVGTILERPSRVIIPSE